MRRFVGKMPPWSGNERERVKRMWEAGNSLSKIADATGRSKMAVAGQVSRMGLFKRTGGAAAQKAAAVRSIKAQQLRHLALQKQEAKPAPVAPPEPAVVPVPLPARLGCRFIIGDLRQGGHWCGAETGRHRSWCDKHYAVVFIPLVQRIGQA